MVDLEMYEKFGQFIDGQWSPSFKNDTYKVINPATEEIIGEASKASPEDVEKALKSAEKGLQIWKKTAPWQRAYIIRKIAKKTDLSMSLNPSGMKSRQCLSTTAVLIIKFRVDTSRRN